MEWRFCFLLGLFHNFYSIHGTVWELWLIPIMIYTNTKDQREDPAKIDILKPCWEAISSHFVIYVWSSCDLFVSKCNVLIWLLCCHFYDCLQLFALSRSTFNGIAGSIVLLVYKKAYFQRKVTDIPTCTVNLKHFAWKHFHILQHLRRILLNLAAFLYVI